MLPRADSRIAGYCLAWGGDLMARRLDTATAADLISTLDSHFASKRRYLMPPYVPTGIDKWSSGNQTLDRDGFQKIADEMRAYLGLSQAARVRLLTEAFDHEGSVGSGLGGMQWSDNPLWSEIVLSCRPHFLTVHVAAALAHEMTHSFLRYHEFRDEDEDRNELLTEAGAVYLGMGVLMGDGYAPVSWQAGNQTLTSSVGYIDEVSISMLMGLSSHCSGCHYAGIHKEASASSQHVDYISSPHVGTATSTAMPKRGTKHGTKPATKKRALSLFKRWQEQRRYAREGEMARISRAVESLGYLCARIEATFASQSWTSQASTLIGPKWSELGKAYALYASGQMRLEVQGLKARMLLQRESVGWNGREIKALGADMAKEVKLLQNVLDLLGRLDS